MILCLLHRRQDEKALRSPQDRLERILVGSLPASKGLEAVVGRGRTMTGTAKEGFSVGVDEVEGYKETR